MGSLNFRGFACALATAIALASSGCIQKDKGAIPVTNASTTSGSSSSSTAIPGGVKAARIIFKAGASGSQASFDSSDPVIASGLGTTTALKAIRIFDPQNNLIVSGTNATTGWPGWLSDVELSVSGSATAYNADCARFADSVTEPSAVNCDLGVTGSGVATTTCGAPALTWRVSEYDCMRNAATQPATGTGVSTDPVFIRVKFNRSTDVLGSTENILAVLEYSSAALNPAPANPSTCFTGGVFSPSTAGCADFVWQGFFQTGAGTPITPAFSLLVPPFHGYVFTPTGSTGVGGGGVTTRQFILPLASYPYTGASTDVSVFQFSRIRNSLGLPIVGSNFQKACNPANAGTASDTPACVGMIFYSLTLYRI